MAKFQIRHKTTYRYSAPVELGPHHMMLRARECHDVQLLSMTLSVEPHAAVTWTLDSWGNSVATAMFQGTSALLVIEALSDVELMADHWPVFTIAASALTYPFQYSEYDAAALAALMHPHHADPDGRLRTWVNAFVRSNPTDTLSLLKDINSGVPAWVSYQSRDAEGTQSPLQSIEREWGSCRDLAMLFIEAVRTLGFAARVVSGYLHNPGMDSVGSSDSGSTHAWAEVFVPGAGWIAFDPTNRSVGGGNLVPVSVGRDIGDVMPVVGSFVGAGAYAHMSVEVEITDDDANSRAKQAWRIGG